jgi:HSP20 family molecular chaperone IbpA
MYYNTRYSSAISKLVDNVFTFPYSLEAFQDSFAYDSIKANKDGSTTISVVVAGFSKEDLELIVGEGRLSLSSKDKEKRLSKFWNLADTADTKNITAECKNGILNITIAGKQKQDKSRTIEIK